MGCKIILSNWQLQIIFRNYNTFGNNPQMYLQYKIPKENSNSKDNVYNNNNFDYDSQLVNKKR